MELNPNWARKDLSQRTAISFDCPLCKQHRIVVPFKGEKPIWELQGDSFENMTLVPSIAHQTHYADGIGREPRLCNSHFFITKGEVVLA